MQVMSLNFFTVIFFGFLPLCAGYALAWAIRSGFLRLRKRAVAAALFGSFLMLAMVGYAPDDPRYTGMLSIALITTVVLSIVVWLLYPRWLSRLSGTAIAAIGGLAALCAVPAFLCSFMKMHPTDYGTVRSPDGRYEARLIYYDGLTYGYYYVSIQCKLFGFFFRGYYYLFKCSFYKVERSFAKC